jgi:hypothetical protein
MASLKLPFRRCNMLCYQSRCMTCELQFTIGQPSFWKQLLLHPIAERPPVSPASDSPFPYFLEQPPAYVPSGIDFLEAPPEMVEIQGAGLSPIDHRNQGPGEWHLLGQRPHPIKHLVIGLEQGHGERSGIANQAPQHIQRARGELADEAYVFEQERPISVVRITPEFR